MKENIILIVVPAAAVITILLVKDRISDRLWQRRNPPERIAADIHTRLLRTDWTFYERHLQRSAPVALRELYCDTALISACISASGKRGGISSFEPLNEDSMIDTRDQLGYDIVPFATSDCGDPIYLRPGAHESLIPFTLPIMTTRDTLRYSQTRLPR